MNNMIVNIRTQLQKLKCRIANLSSRVTYIEDNCCDGGGGDGIQSIQEGDNISIDNTDPQNPIVSSIGGDSTPTLSEVLTQDNDAEDNTIRFSYDGGIEPQIAEIGFLQPPGFLGKTPAFGTTDTYVTPKGFYSSSIDGFFNVAIVKEFGGYSSLSTNVHQTQSKGITANQYFGANYDDNTYVQKKYVDDAIDTIPTPSLTLEQARQNGNVLEGDVRLLNEEEEYDSVIGFEVFNPISGDYDLVGFSGNSNTDNILFGRNYGDYKSGIEFLSGSARLYSNSNGIVVILSTEGDHFSLQAPKNGKGLLGNQEFNKQGDRKAFAQIADVQDANSYSTTETLTGGTWIDGKPIYRKVFQINGVGAELSSLDRVDISDFDVDKVVTIGGHFFDGADYHPVNSTRVHPEEIRASLLFHAKDGENSIVISYGVFNISSGVVSGLDWDYTIILEYTKTTDD